MNFYAVAAAFHAAFSVAIAAAVWSAYDTAKRCLPAEDFAECKSYFKVASVLSLVFLTLPVLAVSQGLFGLSKLEIAALVHLYPVSCCAVFVPANIRLVSALRRAEAARASDI